MRRHVVALFLEGVALLHQHGAVGPDDQTTERMLAAVARGAGDVEAQAKKFLVIHPVTPEAPNRSSSRRRRGFWSRLLSR